MKNNLYIIGTGGSALEIACFALDTKEWILAGFIELDSKMNGNNTITIRDNNYPVIPEDIFFNGSYKGCNVAITINAPEIRKAIFEKYKGYSSFPNIIHVESKIYDTSVIIGIGNIITPQCVFTTNIHVGNFNYFNTNTTIGHHCSIGSFNVFGPGTRISGNSYIGNENFFGVNSIVLQRIKIGNNIRLGACSVLMRNSKDGYLYHGNPAKIIDL